MLTFCNAGSRRGFDESCSGFRTYDDDVVLADELLTVVVGGAELVDAAVPVPPGVDVISVTREAASTVLPRCAVSGCGARCSSLSCSLSMLVLLDRGALLCRRAFVQALVTAGEVVAVTDALVHHKVRALAPIQQCVPSCS